MTPQSQRRDQTLVQPVSRDCLSPRIRSEPFRSVGSRSEETAVARWHGGRWPVGAFLSRRSWEGRGGSLVWRWPIGGELPCLVFRPTHEAFYYKIFSLAATTMLAGEAVRSPSRFGLLQKNSSRLASRRKRAFAIRISRESLRRKAVCLEFRPRYDEKYYLAGSRNVSSLGVA